MSLADYEPPTETISATGRRGKAAIEVHGISVDDLVRIFTAELPQIGTAYALWQKTKARQFSELGFMTQLVSKTPELVAEVICCAADERSKEARAGAAKLPVGVQVMALEAVYRLTLQDCGGLKNLLAILGMVRDDLAEPTDALPGSQKSPAADSPALQ